MAPAPACVPSLAELNGTQLHGRARLEELQPPDTAEPRPEEVEEDGAKPWTCSGNIVESCCEGPGFDKLTWTCDMNWHAVGTFREREVYATLELITPGPHSGNNLQLRSDGRMSPLLIVGPFIDTGSAYHTASDDDMTNQAGTNKFIHAGLIDDWTIVDFDAPYADDDLRRTWLKVQKMLYDRYDISWDDAERLE